MAGRARLSIWRRSLTDRKDAIELLSQFKEGTLIERDFVGSRGSFPVNTALMVLSCSGPEQDSDQ
jgi:hypothetical protein